MGSAGVFLTGVYRLFNYGGALIYVGMGNPKSRIPDHVNTKDWGPEIDESRTLVEWFPTREEAAQAEAAAIKAERPRYNILGTEAHQEQMREVYQSRLNAGRTSASRVPQPFTNRRCASVTEISLRLGVSNQRVHQLSARTDWPEPLDHLAMGKIWRIEDVEAWITDHRPALHDTEVSHGVTPSRKGRRDLPDRPNRRS